MSGNMLSDVAFRPRNLLCRGCSPKMSLQNRRSEGSALLLAVRMTHSGRVGRSGSPGGIPFAIARESGSSGLQRVDA